MHDNILLFPGHHPFKQGFWLLFSNLRGSYFDVELQNETIQNQDTCELPESPHQKLTEKLTVRDRT